MPALPKPKDEKLAQILARGEVSQIEACGQAGFSKLPAHASNKCNQVHILGRIQELRDAKAKIAERAFQIEMETTADAAKQLGLSKYWVLEKLRDNAVQSLRGYPLFNREGDVIGYRPDAQGANKALHLIGLELGMFVERHEVGGPGDFARLTDEELNAKVKADAEALGMDAEAIQTLLLTYDPKDEKEE